MGKLRDVGVGAQVHATVLLYLIILYEAMGKQAGRGRRQAGETRTSYFSTCVI